MKLLIVTYVQIEQNIQQQKIHKMLTLKKVKSELCYNLRLHFRYLNQINVLTNQSLSYGVLAINRYYSFTGDYCKELHEGGWQKCAKMKKNDPNWKPDF